MDHDLSRRAKKHKKREEKLRREKAQALGQDKHAHRVEARQLGRQNIFILVGIVLIVSIVAFINFGL